MNPSLRNENDKILAELEGVAKDAAEVCSMQYLMND